MASVNGFLLGKANVRLVVLASGWYQLPACRLRTAVHEVSICPMIARSAFKPPPFQDAIGATEGLRCYRRPQKHRC
jgi:hypothetical protein